MTTKRSFLLATSGFVQAFALPGTVSAQNVFGDELCQPGQPSPNGAGCEDLGCAAQGGRCTPTQAQIPQGQGQQDEIQGCICERPQAPTQNECQMVHDHQGGNPYCVDLHCPPLQEYNCDPSCQCPTPHDFGDPRCQPDQDDPTQCVDLGCSQIGGLCLSVEAQFPDGQDHLGCHCEVPPQSGPGGGCEIVIDHATGQQICADLDCGSEQIYECNPANCSCLCDSTIPLEVTNQRWPSKVLHDWDVAFCATVYNVNRQIPPFINCGGVACSYGPCQWSGLVANNAAQTATPLLGGVHFFLVTGENLSGEGPMGFSRSAGSLFARPNVSPCPTPPPAP